MYTECAFVMSKYTLGGGVEDIASYRFVLLLTGYTGERSGRR